MEEAISNIKKRLSRYPKLYAIGHSLFSPLNNLRIELTRRINNHIYRKYALEALTRFVNCMDNNQIPYTLAFGSILGAIREHGFIKHDLDIDTAIWIDDYTDAIPEVLQRNGFKWLYRYTVADGKLGMEDTFSYRGVHIDIFYIYPAIDNYPYCCEFVRELGMESNSRLARRIEIPFSHERRLVSFEDIQVYIPDNAEEFCEFRYGKNYMVPDPTWNWIEEKNSVYEWREMIPVSCRVKFPDSKL